MFKGTSNTIKSLMTTSIAEKNTINIPFGGKNGWICLNLILKLHTPNNLCSKKMPDFFQGRFMNNSVTWCDELMINQAEIFREIQDGVQDGS